MARTKKRLVEETVESRFKKIWPDGTTIKVSYRQEYMTEERPVTLYHIPTDKENRWLSEATLRPILLREEVIRRVAEKIGIS